MLISVDFLSNKLYKKKYDEYVSHMPNTCGCDIIIL